MASLFFSVIKTIPFGINMLELERNLCFSKWVTEYWWAGRGGEQNCKGVSILACSRLSDGRGRMKKRVSEENSLIFLSPSRLFRSLALARSGLSENLEQAMSISASGFEPGVQIPCYISNFRWKYVASLATWYCMFTNHKLGRFIKSFRYTCKILVLVFDLNVREFALSITLRHEELKTTI